MNPTECGYQQVNGIRLYYERYGSGQPVILIHGGGSSIRLDFEQVIRRLSGAFELIGIDLQNHGRSDHRQVPETFQQDARDIIGVLDALGIKKTCLLGFSNGASTALQVAHLFADRVEKVIAASGVTARSGMIEGFFEGMNLATTDHMPGYLKDHFLALHPEDGDQKLQNMFEKDSQRMIHFEDWDPSILQSIQAPVLLIAGDRDVVRTTHTVEMSHWVPDARLLILPATHGSFMMADENGNLDSALIDFVTSQISKFLRTP